MGRASNYADREADQFSGSLTEHRDRLSFNQRTYSPSDTENEEGGYGTLPSNSVTDCTFKAARFYPADPGNSTREQLERQMPTYRPGKHSRACGGCGLTACLSLITHTPTACA